MIQLLVSFLTGMVFGAVYTVLKLPLPAPTALAGILGIVGVYVGYLVMSYFTK